MFLTDHIIIQVCCCSISNVSSTIKSSPGPSWVPGQTAAHTDPGNLCRMADFQGEKTWRQ